MDLPPTDPLDIGLRQYGATLAVAFLGGIVSYVSKVRSGAVKAWSVMHLIGELATSAFAGLLCFWLCTFANTPGLVTISLVGIAGHMGARAIAVFESWAAKRWGISVPPVEATDNPTESPR